MYSGRASYGNTFAEIENKLKKSAQHFVDNTGKNGDDVYTYSLSNLAKSVLSQDYFENFDKETISRNIKDLEDFNMAFIEFNKMAEKGTKINIMPMILEALDDIFSNSDEMFRQQYFYDLIDYYYQLLCDNQEGNLLEKSAYDQGIKLMLPIVKMKLITSGLQVHGSKNNKEIMELLKNLGFFFKCLRLNQEDIYEVVRTKVGSNDYTLISYQLIPTDKVNGLLGEYFKLIITINFEGNLETFNFFSKFLTPKSKLLWETAQSGLSKKEDFFYTKYIPLLKENGISSLLDCVPKCYFSRENDVIVLDDMMSLEFTVLPQNTLLEYNVLRKGVNQLAKLHASTIILEEILSEKADKKITIHDIYEEYLREMFFVPGDDFFLKPSFDAGVNSIYHLFTIFPEVTETMPSIDINSFVDKYWKLSFEQVKKSASLRNAICHGDIHAGNLLYKFDKDGTLCKDIYLVDFQLLRYCPPSHDLLFFIYNNSTKKIRQTFLNLLCDEYYSSVSKHVEEFGLDVKTVFPKKDFEESLEYMRSQAVMQSLYYTAFTKLPTNITKEIFGDQEKENYYMFKYRWKLMDLGLDDEVFRNNVKELLEDLVDIIKKSLKYSKNSRK